MSRSPSTLGANCDKSSGMNRLGRTFDWLPSIIQRITGVDERTSRLAGLLIAVVVVSCGAQATADVLSSAVQTLQLEHDSRLAQKGYRARTQALIANQATSIHNQNTICRQLKLPDCISVVARPDDR